MPNRPSSRICCTIAAGNSSACSISDATGITSRAMKRRTVSTISRRISGSVMFMRLRPRSFGSDPPALDHFGLVVRPGLRDLRLTRPSIAHEPRPAGHGQTLREQSIVDDFGKHGDRYRTNGMMNHITLQGFRRDEALRGRRLNRQTLRRVLVWCAPYKRLLIGFIAAVVIDAVVMV